MKEAIPAVFAAVIGAIVGSFLNACIHRLPRGIPLNNPRRSFCPACHRAILWTENIPVLSWFLLRGRCSTCRAKISFRYPLVELLTASLFLATWIRFGVPLAPVYWVLLALLIAATFIDIEHFLIPDEITLGGAAAGLILSALFPQMMQATSHFESLCFSLGAAALGFGLLWLIVELGKMAFGRKRHRFEKEEPFAIRPEGDAATLQIGEEVLCWEDIFARESDELVLECASASIAGERPVLRFRHDRMIVANQETPLAELEAITGTLRAVSIPREAMGFGDVKLIAAIGAFLGWKAVLFSVGAASIIGCVAAFAGIFLARDRAGARVPFGPFLALGAVLWRGNVECVFWNLCCRRRFLEFDGAQRCYRY
jgi:leader peptidase (prepilin peptidase) / N-methyltransferase